MTAAYGQEYNESFNKAINVVVNTRGKSKYYDNNNAIDSTLQVAVTKYSFAH